MKYLIFLVGFLFFSHSNAYNTTWGKTGHRTVGEVASHYLDAKAKKAVTRILHGESMAIASTWMDDIKSDPKYDKTHDWHWVTIPDGETYAESKKNPNGDVIRALRTIIANLKKGTLSETEETIQLKMLIHLVGDIHQPLHVGKGDDQGGNDVKVRWFWSTSNLHRVWDSGMIDQSQLSYTELADAVDHPTPEQIKEWQNSKPVDWAYESMKLRKQVYDLPKDKNLNYDYQYHHWQIVENRLLQAGVRLAGVINDIYG